MTNINWWIRGESIETWLDQKYLSMKWSLNKSLKAYKKLVEKAGWNIYSHLMIDIPAEKNANLNNEKRPKLITPNGSSLNSDLTHWGVPKMLAAEISMLTKKIIADSDSSPEDARMMAEIVSLQVHKGLDITSKTARKILFPNSWIFSFFK